MSLWGKSRDRTILVKLALALCFLVVILSFQNCGSFDQQGALFSDGTETIRNDDDCLSSVVGCGHKPEFLVLQTEMPVPYEIPVNHAKPITSGGSTTFFRLYFDIHGVCNDGDYLNHEVEWGLVDSAVSDDAIATEKVQNPCKDGQFNVAGSIIYDSRVTVGKDYDLYIRIFGIDPITGVPTANPRLEHEDIITIRFYEASEGQ